MRAALLLLAFAASAAAQTVPTLTGRVVDTADMVSPATEASITARLAAFEDSTSTQIVVLTVPSLGGGDLEAFSTDVFRTWGIGQEGSNNGALLLIARDDRTLRIEVGYGLEGDLTDATAATIIREVIVPRMRDGDPDSAVSAGVDAMVASVKGTTIVPADEPTPWWAELIFGSLFAGVPLIGLGAFLRTGFAGFWGTVAAGLVAVVVSVFVAIGVAIATGSITVVVVCLVAVPLLAMIADVILERHPVYGPARRKRRERNRIIREAQRKGKRSVVIDGQRVSVPTMSSGSSSGGGGFSGGGGSSGGGGASGGW